MKKVLINVEERELRVAIMDDDQLVELYIESLDEKSILNNIYKGRVEDVLPGLKAAFVNVGLERNAFLHFDDVRPDLLWNKYRELNPDMADEVPTAREALASVVDSESEADSDDDSGDKRKRRRGRRGGKKRRPDSEDSYTPGLPVGVSEDDLEDDDEDVSESTPVAASAASSDDHHDSSDDDDAPAPRTADSADSAGEAAADSQTTDEAEARKLARMEKQRQRRERWEQKKLERQQRRQQERAERQAQKPAEEQQPVEPELPPPAYGTRGAASAYDSYTPAYSPGNRRQHKARYGDSFGNVAVTNNRRQDHRDSQVDFFGPVTAQQEEETSIWDERQPNLGPVPGMGKQFLPDMNGNRGNRRTSNRQGSGGGGNQQHGDNRNRKRSGGGNSNNNKRRGGKKRSMRKRDNRSFFAFSADDIDEKNVTEEVTPVETEATEKPVRKRATTAKTTTRKTAAKKDTEKKPAAKTTRARTTTTRKKKDADAETPVAEVAELPLDIPADEPAEKKPAAKAAETTPKKTTTRTRRTTTASKRAASATKETETPAKESPAPVSEMPAAAASADEPAPASKPAPAEKPVESTPASETSAAAPESPAQPAAESATVSETSPEPASTTDSASTESAQAEATKPAEESGRSHQRPRRPSRAERMARQRERKAEAARKSSESGEPKTHAGSGNGHGNGSSSQSSGSTDSSHSDKGRERDQSRRDRKRLRRPNFQEVFKKGDEIMVQVVKEEIGTKGARISSYVSLPGRYLVLLPYPNQEGGISRKVEDIRERKRLKNLLRDISSDETAFIIRTAGIYQEEKEIRNDVEFLSHEWSTIADRYKKSDATSLVYDDHDILYRLARDVFDDSVAEIHIDSHTEFEKLKGILGKLIPGLVDKVNLYSGPENIFHKFGVTKQIQKAARRKVWLKSGGYLIIDEAEALTAIDVNTGKSVGKDDQEKLILRTNLEAARAVARELKLRDIGGLIVIDFIDMKDARNKDQVLSELKLQLRKDRSKTSVSAISEFGLVEMTRKRVRRSLRKTLFMDCPYCQGAGVVLNEQQIWLHIKHEVLRQLESAKPAPSLAITVNPRIRAYIDQNYREVIRRLEQKYDTEIRFSMSDIFHIENYQIESLDSTRELVTGSATVPTR